MTGNYTYFFPKKAGAAPQAEVLPADQAMLKAFSASSNPFATPTGAQPGLVSANKPASLPQFQLADKLKSDGEMPLPLRFIQRAIQTLFPSADRPIGLGQLGRPE